MLISDGRITMTEGEWQEFAEATFAPWRPRTIDEFNAMCDLGRARHLADNTEGSGFMHAIAAEDMKFTEDGQPNFPLDKRKMAYVKVHGTWPTQKEFEAFDRTSNGDVGEVAPASGLKRVK